MSEKKELNNEELEKVTGGFHTIGDSIVGSTVKLKYRGAFNIVKKIDAKVLEAAMLDGHAAGTKMYKLNVKNGYAVGWFPAHYVTGGSVFFSKSIIKSTAYSLETIQGWESNASDDWGD